MLKRERKNLLDVIYSVITVLIFLLGFYITYDYIKKSKKEEEISKIKLEVMLPFDRIISNKYTCDGENKNFWIIIKNYEEIRRLEKKYRLNFSIKVEMKDSKSKIIWQESFPLKYKIEENSAKNYKGVCPPMEFKEDYYLVIHLLENKRGEISKYTKKLEYKRVNILDVLYNLSKVNQVKD